MGATEMLAELDAAIKGITEVSDLGESILAPGQLDRFIRSMQEQTVILPAARFMQMRSQQENIDRVAFMGRIMHGSVTQEGAHRSLDAETEYAKPATQTNKLIANELKAIVPLRDKALRRNIERGQFQNTIVELMGEAAGRDFEEYGTFADKDFDPSDDNMLCLTNGWAKLSPNKVYGVGADKDFDPTKAEEIFEALLQAIPKQFLQDLSSWRFYVDWETANAYRDYLIARGTALGDTATTSGAPIPYKGIPVEVVPLFSRAKAEADGGTGRIAMLQYPDNMVWGVFEEVGVEPQRSAIEGVTYQVLTIEADANYEDENASAVAYLELEAPAS